MIRNLFSIFDPVSRNMFLSNWISILIFFFFMPFKKWYIINRLIYMFNSMCLYVLSEFKPLLNKNSNLLIFILAIFLFIIINNSLGLLCYIFTARRHIVFTLTLVLPVWLGLILYMCMFNINNSLIHLIPQGTPGFLTPFIVLIETIRNLIRPVTLAVRLGANIISGHLLLVLIRSAVLNIPYFSLLVIPTLIALILLEIAVAFIQAYVIRILITLYAREAIS